MKEFTCLVLIAVCGSFGSLCSQPRSQKINKLVEEVSHYTYSNQYDSAHAVVVLYLESPDLDDIEIFHGHFLIADILRASGKPETAIKRLKDCKIFLNEVLNSTPYESLLEGKTAECYFDLMNYKDAKAHAELSININPDSNLRNGGHAVNHLIIGYSDYLEKDYKHALEHYDLATKEYLLHGEACELPLVYTKMAKAYNALGKKELSEEHISKAVLISDSCSIETYKLLSKRAMLEIYQENKNYAKAFEVLHDVNLLVEKLEDKKQAQQLSELEVKYKTKLIQNENENLRQINQKNEEILGKQKQALVITFIGIGILFFLLVILRRISTMRKKAEQKLAIFNAELEQIIVKRTDHLQRANDNISENSALLAGQNKQLVDFCNIVSHNLRSPLSNMSMLVDYIEKSKNEAEQKEAIEKLKPVISNLTETFNELVESLQVRQDLEIKSENIVVEECLERIINGLEGEIKNSKAVIDTDFSDAPTVYYPPKYLSSILHNLVSNSLKYRSPDRVPIIKLETRKNKGNIVLSIKDNGLGIDLDTHKNDIFKIRKVFHEHPDAKGFGLYITKTQIETMGGRIWVESTPGEGSMFFIEINE